MSDLGGSSIPRGTSIAPFFDFIMEWIPTIGVVVEGMDIWSQRLEDVEPLLENIVDDIMIPSIHQNFLEGGRPAWEPLADGTIAQKQTDAILIESGNLLDTVLDPSNWAIKAERGPGGEAGGIAMLADLPGAEYGYYHVTGTQFMPARNFLLFQDSDLDAMDAALGNWVDQQTLGFGFFN